MAKIKILRIITRLNIGGPAVHAVLLTKELENDSFESRLICGTVSKAEGDMHYLAEMNNVEPIYISSLRREMNIFRDTIAFFKILSYMWRYKPDIVHTHTAKAGTLGRIAAILLNIPVKIHTFHGHIFHGYFGKTRTDFFLKIERALARFTDVIIAISEGQKEEIVNAYKVTSPEKCLVIRLGFELDKFLNAESKKSIFRKTFKFLDSDILVGIVGRLTPIKNHRMFMDTADYIRKNASGDLSDKIKFVIIGDGELKQELLAYMLFKKLREKLVFVGWIRDMSEAYRDLDVMTLTSINEGTPVSLIEAMACAKPVISVNVGGVKAAVGDAGILVRKGDYEAMGKKVLELLESAEKRRELGKRGREFVKDRYSKERLVRELSELYRDLKRRGHPACRVSPTNKEQI